MSDAPYLAVVVAHYRQPRNQRVLATPTHRYEGTNPLCGDRMRMEVVLEGERLVEVAFQSSACAIATASASLLTVRLHGARVADVNALDDREVIAALGAGVPAGRHACATLALRVLRRALDLPAA